jgi:hypothetical protein
LKKGLKHHGWVMGHGWGSHGGTWKMGGWGRNIALETLHVPVGYVSRAWATRALKCTLGCLLKLNMFKWVVGFEVLVSRIMFCGVQFWTNRNKCQATTKTRYVFVLVCFGVHSTHVWKHVLNCLKVSNAFTTCH